MRLRGVGPASPVVSDERAPRIVDVDHGARVAQQRGRDRVRDFGGHLAALPDGVRDVGDRTVYVVRDVEDVAVRDHALHRVVVEQRPTRMAAQDERQLPRQVVAVVQPRVEPLPAERAREVGGVADQETPAVRQARDDPPVHPKRREPGDVGGSTPPAEPYLGAGGDVFGGYRLYRLFQVLEGEPAPARERREQQQAIRTADDVALVARERRPHRDVGDEEMALVGGALERLAHRVARAAVRPTRIDDDAGVDRLDAAVRVRELDEDVVVRIRLHLRRRDPPLDRAAERREMGLEDSLGLVLREAALKLTAAIDALEGHGVKLGHVRPVHADAVDVLGGLEERRQQADGIQDLEGARLYRGGPSLVVRPHLPFHEPRIHAVAHELGGGEKPRGAGADDQNVLSHQYHPRKPAAWHGSLANHQSDRRGALRPACPFWPKGSAYTAAYSISYAVFWLNHLTRSSTRRSAIWLCLI